MYNVQYWLLMTYGLVVGQAAPAPGFGAPPVPSYAAPRPVNVAPPPALASMSLSGGVPITPNKKDPFADLSVL
jgi:hypothetical protein